MERKNKICFCAALCFLFAFFVWTAAVCHIDVQPIGPQGTAVGFASVNRAFHELTGVHLVLYAVTDWLSGIPLGIAAGFGLFGLLQWIRRKNLQAVDVDILLLGLFYCVVFLTFCFFERCIVNYRPVLIDGKLEASYPSSTTMLVLCIMPTAVLQFCMRVQRRCLRRRGVVLAAVFTVGMLGGRVLSGVHWLTDIIGGVLVSAGLVLLYAALVRFLSKEQ